LRRSWPSFARTGAIAERKYAVLKMCTAHWRRRLGIREGQEEQTPGDGLPKRRLAPPLLPQTFSAKEEFVHLPDDPFSWQAGVQGAGL
jgi:hypothetical protein